MANLDQDSLSLHLEVALSGATPVLLSELQHADQRCRARAVEQLARHLAERLRCCEFRWEEDLAHVRAQPSLFPDDLGPIG